MKEFIDRTEVTSGTPLNRNNMMAMQGYIGKTIRFIGDAIEEVNSDGHVTTTTSDASGNIIETFVGDKTITKKTMFNSDGSITEVIL